MTNEAAFMNLLNSGEAIIQADKAKIVYIGETPRFANNNLGWIGIGEELGEADGLAYHEYSSWIYRPPLVECEAMFASGNFVWNTGYFVTTSGFILEAYQEFQPTIWNGLHEISQSMNGPEYLETLHRVYPGLESVSFDDAIVQNFDSKLAVVLHGTTGWSDPGTLYALKESVDSDPDVNVKKGLVVDLSTRDSLLYNYEEGKLLAVAGLDGMVVVNTEDALLVVHKDDINLVKEIVNGLIATELEKYS
jgi:mannose-1-phosphate guanylyltransferase